MTPLQLLELLAAIADLHHRITILDNENDNLRSVNEELRRQLVEHQASDEKD